MGKKPRGRGRERWGTFKEKQPGKKTKREQSEAKEVGTASLLETKNERSFKEKQSVSIKCHKENE